MITTLQERERFEAWMRDEFFGGLDEAGPWDDKRNCYVRFDSHMAWKGWSACLESHNEQAKE